MRPGESWALEYQDLVLKGASRRIDVWERVGRRNRLDSPKNGNYRQIVLPPPAWDAIQGIPRLHPTLIFTTPNGKQFGQAKWLYYWHRIRDAFTAELDETHWLRRRIMADPKKGRFDVYELRHLACTYMIEPPPHGLGLSHADAAIQLGHTDGGKLVAKLYGHPDEERTRERIEDAWKSVGEDAGGFKFDPARSQVPPPPPVEPSDEAPPAPRRSITPDEKRRRASSRSILRAMVELGMLKPGEQLVHEGSRGRVTATLNEVGEVFLPRDRTPRSLSAAAVKAVGKSAAGNGWEFWKVKRDGKWIPLKEIRQARLPDGLDSTQEQEEPSADGAS
jgi:hypothetical protein